jgi:hypothetical protein
MNSRISVFILAFLSVFILQSCYTPANLVKLMPNEEPNKWLYGQALVIDSVYGINYEVGFDRLSNKQYLFDFHIENRSNMPILIDPTQFYYIPLDTGMNPIIPEKVTALDPETAILEIEKHLSVNEARSKNQLGISLMAIGADVATGIIVASDDKPNNDFVQRAIADGVHVGIYASGVANEAETYDLYELRESWASSTIRKTTLGSNYSMHGKVFFPASPNASYIQIQIPVDDQWLQFTFKQVQIKVSRE